MEFRQDRNETSQELTVVFLRGNGSPRTFRVKVPAIQRSILTVSLTLSACLVIALASIFFYVFQPERKLAPAPAPAPVAQEEPVAAPEPAPAPEPMTPAPAPVAETPKPEVKEEPAPAVTTAPAGPGILDRMKGIFQSKSGSYSEPARDASETEKEISGLREDIAKLNAKLDGRRELPKDGGHIQFLGSRSELMATGETPVKIRSVKTGRNDAAKETFVNFELYNASATQAQVRGYIVVIAKSPDSIAVYPAGAFSPSENILVNFTKGETFAISRGRMAHAKFPLLPTSAQKLKFQILLFSTDGKLYLSEHVEEN